MTVSGFSQTCQMIRLMGNNLRAQCDTNGGPPPTSTSSLMLNNCLGNNVSCYRARPNIQE